MIGQYRFFLLSFFIHHNLDGKIVWCFTSVNDILLLSKGKVVRDCHGRGDVTTTKHCVCVRARVRYLSKCIQSTVQSEIKKKEKKCLSKKAIHSWKRSFMIEQHNFHSELCVCVCVCRPLYLPPIVISEHLSNKIYGKLFSFRSLCWYKKKLHTIFHQYWPLNILKAKPSTSIGCCCCCCGCCILLGRQLGVTKYNQFIIYISMMMLIFLRMDSYFSIQQQAANC